MLSHDRNIIPKFSPIIGNEVSENIHLFVMSPINWWKLQKNLYSIANTSKLSLLIFLYEIATIIFKYDDFYNVESKLPKFKYKLQLYDK